MPEVVTVGVAEEFKKQMAKPDLVFVTKENEERIKAAAAAQSASACEHCGRQIIGPHDCPTANGEEVEEAVDEPKND